MLRNLPVFLFLLLTLTACKTLSPETSQLNHSESQQNIASADINTTKTSAEATQERQAKIRESASLIHSKTKPVALKNNTNEKIVTAILLDPDTIDADVETAPTETVIEPEIITEIIPEIIPVKDVWSRLRDGMSLPHADNKRIKAQRAWFVKNKKYLQRVMLRAKPLLPYILDELEKQGLPSEFALLPIVESAYQTYAYSHGRASGIWQIIPSTGRYLGLKQDWWYDGRRDLYLSSKAALKYLKTLTKQFKGDSVLALASYNAGPGKIRSAVRYNKKKNRPTDFWHLTKIRPETRDYVPKLYALKQIFSNPEDFDIELLPIVDEPGFEIALIKNQIDISKAALLAEMSLDEFYLLNPAFNHWATPPKGEYHLLLPIGKKAVFEKNYAQLPASERIKWVRHKIKSGETLSHIADKYNTRISLIKSVNKIKKSNIRAGKFLMIPTSTQSLYKYANSNNARIARTQKTKRGKTKFTYHVKQGENLWTISRRYGVSHKSLAKWNGMAPIDTLKVGQKLVIWDSKQKITGTRKTALVSFSSPQQKIIQLKYTVKKGDSIAHIANRFNVKISDIKKWNKIGKYIQPGQKIKLWVDVTSQST